MFRDKSFFTKIFPASGKVLLGDGHTSLPIQGIVMVHCRIGEHEMLIPKVQYVPDLTESIYSIFQHIQTLGHGIHSSFDEGLFLQFPNFKSKALIGQNDIYEDAVPFSTSTGLSTSTVDSSTASNDTFC